MSIAAMKQAQAKIKSAQVCHLSATKTLLDEADELLRTAIQEAEAKATWNRNIRDSVDSLLTQAGYAEDSSARHQLGMMNFDAAPSQSAKPLTNDEINDLMEIADAKWSDADVDMHWARHFARAIEAAHGITGEQP